MVAFNVDKKNIYTVLFALPFIMIAPLIFGSASGFLYYADDYQRLVSGKGDYWSANGRPIAQFLIETISGGKLIVDFSPIGVLIGLLSVTSALIYVFRNKIDDNSNYIWIIAAWLANPFLIQNYLYIYDSATMLLAMAMAFLAAEIGKGKRYNFFLTFILSLGVLCLYQAALPIIIIMIFFIYVIDERLKLNFVLEKTISLVVALIVYLKVLSKFLTRDEYNISHSQLIDVKADLFNVVGQNILSLKYLFFSYYGGYELFFISVILLDSGYCLILYILKELINYSYI